VAFPTYGRSSRERWKNGDSAGDTGFEGFEAGKLGIDDRLEGSEVLDRRNELRARWETLSRRELEDAIEAVRTCEGSIESETHLGWKVGGCCCLAVSCEVVKVEEVKLWRGKRAAVGDIYKHFVRRGRMPYDH